MTSGVWDLPCRPHRPGRILPPPLSQSGADMGETTL
jgi:hypothetical protein